MPVEGLSAAFRDLSVRPTGCVVEGEGDDRSVACPSLFAKAKSKEGKRRKSESQKSESTS
jgi:hypothetical protein